MPFRVLNQRSHQGVNFVEVVEVTDAHPSHAGPLHYAVPGQFGVGSLVDIAVTQAKTAAEVEETAAPEVVEAATAETEVKSGKLPEDFPHKSELEAEGFTTYAKVRGLKGDYSTVPGVGAVKGKEIDAAL